MRFERASAPGRHDGDVAAGAVLSEKSIRSACTACGLFLLAAASIAVPGQAAYADVTFKEVSSISGIRFTGRSFGISAGDLNGDGWPDIFSGNHRSLASLYINNGDGTFTDVIPNNWSNPVLPDGHGAAFADFDNDGDPLFLAHQ